MAPWCRSLPTVRRLDILFAAPAQRASLLHSAYSLLSYFSSVAFHDHDASSGIPKPETMEWNKELSNSVSLIGTLVKNVDIKYLDSGKTFASSYVKVKRPTISGLKDDSIFFVQFWNELAETAAAHLKAGDHIFVAGSVWIENFTGNDNMQRTACKIVAQDLKFVEGHNQEEGEEPKLSVHEQWKDYFDNPDNYWDNRVNKKNPKGPDFKHKLNGSALWIESRSTPSWVKDKLPDTLSIADCDDDASYIPLPTGGIESEELWQMLFGNPSDWWDNRNRKKNPKYPDFKHKMNGSALWIDSRSTPHWVKEKLEGLEFASTEDSGEVTVSTASVSTSDLKSEKLWQAFFANPSDWWDNRSSKKHPRGPDFKHKSTGEALWIGSFSGPKWVKSQLEALDKKSKAAKEQGRPDWPMVSNEKDKKTSFDDADLGIFF